MIFATHAPRIAQVLGLSSILCSIQVHINLGHARRPLKSLPYEQFWTLAEAFETPQVVLRDGRQANARQTLSWGQMINCRTDSSHVTWASEAKAGL